MRSHLNHARLKDISRASIGRQIYCKEGVKAPFLQVEGLFEPFRPAIRDSKPKKGLALFFRIDIHRKSDLATRRVTRGQRKTMDVDTVTAFQSSKGYEWT